ncbi:MAG: lytic transglycosylase domain-containing protein, partial [Acetobacteraceae bacterium]
MTDTVEQYFDDAGRYYNVDPNLLRAINLVESGGNWNTANSSAGAEGGMQFMPATAQALGVNPYDPRSAIFGAADLMAQNLQRYGTPRAALMAYNAGTDPARWDNPQTQAYLGRVATAYGRLRQGLPYQVAAGGNVETDALPSPAAPPSGAPSYGGMSSQAFLNATAPLPAGASTPSPGATAAASPSSSTAPVPDYGTMSGADFLNATAPLPAPPSPASTAPAGPAAADLAYNESLGALGAGPLGIQPQNSAAIGAGALRLAHDLTDRPAEWLASG